MSAASERSERRARARFDIRLHRIIFDLKLFFYIRSKDYGLVLTS